MPLSSLQRIILNYLASHRDPESFVAGSLYLTRRGNRISGDIDIFHDREERVTQAADDDVAALAAGGMTVQWLRRERLFHQALVGQGGETTKLEWVVDSDYRFYPAQRDPDFGYVLHPADLATNKIMAAAGRREPRDIVDLIDIHDTILPVGAVAWAAVGRALGFTPEGLLNEVSRLGRYRPEDFGRVIGEQPIDPAAVMRRLQDVLREANEFVRRMPSDLAGCLFLEGDSPVQPDPDRLGAYTVHQAARRGHWPTSPEIDAAMLERYDRG